MCAQGKKINYLKRITKADYFLDDELSPPGVEACSGSWLTRQVGKEQPSPKLKNLELVSYIQKTLNFEDLFLLKYYYILFQKTNHPPKTLWSLIIQQFKQMKH